MLNFSTKQLIGVGIFIFAIFVGVPFAIAATGRWDFFFTLTSVALLAIASAGVWLTFYIGRINIGQGAFALIGAYVSAILVVKAGWSFWISLPVAGLFGTGCNFDWIANPAFARCLLRDDHVGPNAGRHIDCTCLANNKRR